MKMIRNGREYDYDYKQIILKGSTHKKLKTAADKKGMKMAGFIKHLLETYRDESSI
jgi:hypothetical protein